ncbi:acyltransferase family protein [Sphingomonas sp. MMS24-JH45]
MKHSDERSKAKHRPPTYRPDIDGLRALAVLPVVLFHLGSSWFTGGYVEVDIFFVISGFLISGAIAREIELRQFSILAFYERRARRILPALFAMMLAVTIAGYVIFMPDEFRDMGAALAGVATFSANILFWEQVDYFNRAVELKPLLHTWSLSVEEQFYIFFPLLLIVLSRTRVANRRSFVLILLALSFGASVACLTWAPEANYYLLPTRAWELLIGSVVALGYVPRHPESDACRSDRDRRPVDDRGIGDHARSR